MIHHSVGGISFYITNVCNLNCFDCNYLNNYAIKGHERWADSENSCREWAKKINPAWIAILGGEPLVNPDFLKWVHGIAKIFPSSEIRILTNGTVFHLWPSLYDELLEYKGRVNISISGHNIHKKEEQISWIKGFLKKPITHRINEKEFRTWVWDKTYSSIRDTSWPDCRSFEDYQNLPAAIQQEIVEVHKVNIEDFIIKSEPVFEFETFVDSNNIRIGWAQWDDFETSAIKFDANKQLMTLHNSDPKKAVAKCHGGNCSFIKNGKFYKCQVMGNLPDMINQGFPIELSDEDKELIFSYQPAEPNWDDNSLSKFIEGLQGAPIPQCKFCPEVKTKTRIFATTKKIKIFKKKP